MRHMWLFNLVLGVVLTVALPQGASAKGTMLEVDADYCATGLALQKSRFHRFPSPIGSLESVTFRTHD